MYIMRLLLVYVTEVRLGLGLVTYAGAVHCRRGGGGGEAGVTVGRGEEPLEKGRFAWIGDYSLGLLGMGVGVEGFLFT